MSLGPVKQTVLTELQIMQGNIVHKQCLLIICRGLVLSMETITVQFVCVGGCVDTVEDEPIAHKVQLSKPRHLRQLRNIPM